MVWPDMEVTMSPGPLRGAGRHVLDQADDADDVDLGLARGQRLHGPMTAPAPRHVPLHVFHAGGRLDRDAAGIEGDALADEGDRRCSLRRRRRSTA